MKLGLLVIDVQKQFFSTSLETAQSLGQAIPVINTAIRWFRQKGLPVICVQHINESIGLLPDTEGFALPPSLEILPTDERIQKNYGNSFNKTRLEEILRAQGVDTLIITGYCAEFCVLSTYRGALDKDFTPIILRGAIASRNPGNIPFVESISDIITFTALMKLLV